MSNFENFENIGRELERRGKTEGIKALAESSDGQKLSRMLDADKVERAARSGDAAALQELLTTVLSTREGQNLARSLEKLMKD